MNQAEGDQFYHIHKIMIKRATNAHFLEHLRLNLKMRTNALDPYSGIIGSKANGTNGMGRAQLHGFGLAVTELHGGPLLPGSIIERQSCCERCFEHSNGQIRSQEVVDNDLRAVSVMLAV